MLFVTNSVKSEELKEINNFFNQFENEFDAVKTVETEVIEESPVSLYLTSLVSSHYQKSIQDIENTTIGNKLKRKRSLQQVMKESFFNGANRFGHNFIA